MGRFAKRSDHGNLTGVSQSDRLMAPIKTKNSI
ncbi:hypothetical protein ROA7745_04573 [Roseovarius aestuarii]|uniref:Uncharacterized protein n=1 Tax=Roseovarius aestuarii TaxID=475083 RepID=A0A1X7BYP2_9RHOB|nr:hypothetical protein ROA7745_04573 [Roseovarius aestuarii]